MPSISAFVDVGGVFEYVKIYKDTADDLYRMSKIVKRDCNCQWYMIFCNQSDCLFAE